MRFREALREGWRDVVSGAGQPVIFGLLYFALIGGLVLAAALSTAGTVRDARAYVESGAATYVMKATARIDGRACDTMSSLNNVVAAGALREKTEGVASARLPQTPISLFAVTGGFADLVQSTGDTRNSGLTLSVDVAEMLGLHAGDRMETTRGSTNVASVFDYPDDGRDPLLAFAAIEAVADDGTAFDQCWALIWPQDENAVASLGRTVMSGSAEGADRPVLQQLNQTHGARFAVMTAFDHRAAGPLVVAVAGLLGFAFVLRRRLALASDRHVGVGRLAQVLSQTVQVLLWTIVGSAAAVAAVLVAVRLADDDRLPILQQSLALVGAGGGAAVASCAIAVCLIRHSALFRYFKHR